MQNLPLAGLRIVSFEQFAAAPYGTMFLGDLGAEILKVETHDGDSARRIGPGSPTGGGSLYFQCFNVNKESVFIDLKNSADREFFEQLVKTSHAVVNNLRGNLAAELGIDYASLSRVNTAVVCGHISAYGRNNSRAGWPGFDFLAQAEAGLMALTGEPDGPPTRMGVSAVDYMAGMMMALGLVSAIHAASRTGKGADVDVSLFDAAVHQLAYQGTWYMNERILTHRTPRSAHPSATPVQLFKTADGWLYVACMSEKFWRSLISILQRLDLAEDDSFRSMEQRLAHRDALTEILEGTFSARTTSEWMALLSGKVPVAPVLTLEAALENPFLLQEAQMVRELSGANRSSIKLFTNPIQLNGERLPQRLAPQLGGYTEFLKRQVTGA